MGQKIDGYVSGAIFWILNGCVTVAQHLAPLKSTLLKTIVHHIIQSIRI